MIVHSLSSAEADTGFAWTTSVPLRSNEAELAPSKARTRVTRSANRRRMMRIDAGPNFTDIPLLETASGFSASCSLPSTNCLVHCIAAYTVYSSPQEECAEVNAEQGRTRLRSTRPQHTETLTPVTQSSPSKYLRLALYKLSICAVPPNKQVWELEYIYTDAGRNTPPRHRACRSAKLRPRPGYPQNDAARYDKSISSSASFGGDCLTHKMLCLKSRSMS